MRAAFGSAVLLPEVFVPNDKQMRTRDVERTGIAGKSDCNHVFLTRFCWEAAELPVDCIVYKLTSAVLRGGAA